MIIGGKNIIQSKVWFQTNLNKWYIVFIYVIEL